ncbi:MAG: nucleotidyltransferase [Thermincola sp.]|jgi:predicted nucleotidyltransferase|nr:nucleotidyltransferase [Thermincola sp.]MDT3701539.1 nucleotidyltransferase [Thermincola sp.]
MNVVGLVTEHNPFHNGHLYHVQEARKSCDADVVVSVMSGHFLQRGEPALFNKWARAKMAVKAGVDIVIELPAAFSVRSASTFAHGSVEILNATGIVSHICFGSEAGDINELWPAARLLADEPQEFKLKLAGFLNQGNSFPKARALALAEYQASGGWNPAASEIYGSPNNILGIEYLKAILTTKSNISPVTIKRFSAGYHDSEIGDFDEDFFSIASATSIRQELSNTGELTRKISRVVPKTTLEVMEQEITSGLGPVFIANYAPTLFYLLRTHPKEWLAEMYDVTEGLENRIYEIARTAKSVGDLLRKTKTKRYTWTRLQRILTYIMLDYTKSLAQAFDQTGPLYLRILGLSDKGRQILKTVKKKGSLPVITRTAPFLKTRDELALMLQFDVKATDIYSLLIPSLLRQQAGLDCKIMPYIQEN